MAATRIIGQDIKDGTLTDADEAAANIDGTSGTPSLRTLGTGAAQAAAGNHTHAAGHTHVYSEVPSGTVNGVNAAFTLVATPTSGTLRVYKNGIRQKAASGNDYVLATATITFEAGNLPQTGDTILCDYQT